MKRRVMSATMAMVILSLPLLLAVPTAFAQSGGRGGGMGHSERSGGFGGRAVIGGGQSGGFVGGATRGGVAGGTHRHGFTFGQTHSFGHRPFTGHGHHHHFGYNHSFVFGFGVGVFPPTWGWYGYDPYYYWGLPAYPYYGYYGYPYWSDPCPTSDPAYAPYCPPTADNPYYPGYSVPSVDYPTLAPPVQPESGRESQSPAPPQQPPSPVND